jgi:Ni/Fe-hydrogenase subunit HybB-like protein
VRTSANGLYLVSVLVVAGFVTNRLNVSITGMEASAGLRYIPKWTEVAVTASIVALGIVLFGLAARHLGIFAEEARPLPAPEAAPAVAPHAAD